MPRITSRLRVTLPLMMTKTEEADLLRSLAVGVVESDEARQFLTDIPTVAQLVPSTRLLEIEQGLSDEP